MVRNSKLLITYVRQLQVLCNAELIQLYYGVHLRRWLIQNQWLWCQFFEGSCHLFSRKADAMLDYSGSLYTFTCSRQIRCKYFQHLGTYLETSKCLLLGKSGHSIRTLSDPIFIKLQTYLFCIIEYIICWIYKKHVLWFQVCMWQTDTVKN